VIGWTAGWARENSRPALGPSKPPVQSVPGGGGGGGVEKIVILRSSIRAV